MKLVLFISILCFANQFVYSQSCGADGVLNVEGFTLAPCGTAQPTLDMYVHFNRISDPSKRTAEIWQLPTGWSTTSSSYVGI